MENVLHDSLYASLDAFVNDVKGMIDRQIHNSINVNEVFKTDNNYIRQLVLEWTQRILYETVANEFGETVVVEFFNDSFYQIAAHNLGPHDFSKMAGPYKRSRI
jgi:hypothetical protein